MNESRASRNSAVAVLIIGGLFFVFGFVTWLNGALIPFLTIACELDHVQAYFVTLVFYIAYMVMALPMSLVLRRTGYKNGLALGLVIMAVGALIFVPAAMVRMYSVFLAGLFVLGTGLTILQTAANPYIVLIGPVDTAAVRISIMGLLNKGAGVVAPLLFTALVLADISQFTVGNIESLSPADKLVRLDELSRRLIEPYLAMAGVLVLLAAYIKLSPLPNPEFADKDAASAAPLSVLRHPKLVLGAVTLFFYVGAEVVAGDTIALFGRDLGVVHFGGLTAYTMAFMKCGYLLGVIAIPRWISQERALVVSAALGIFLSILVLVGSMESDRFWTAAFAWTGAPGVPYVVLFVALFGLANALVWPAVWPMALRGLDKNETATGSALLIMGIAGGAIVPVIFGALTESSVDPRMAYGIMLPCYLFILYYALAGHKLDQWVRGSTQTAVGTR
ncbi:MAG: sugar MFS transporter [Proteobacteria bacterium]|nr:sugar MFS transporter [Pseudomonadota bacterium]